MTMQIRFLVNGQPVGLDHFVQNFINHTTGGVLAILGFEVEGVDISPEAVNTALESAEKASVTIRAQVADLEGNYCIKKGACISRCLIAWLRKQAHICCNTQVIQ